MYELKSEDLDKRECKCLNIQLSRPSLQLTELSLMIQPGKEFGPQSKSSEMPPYILCKLCTTLRGSLQR